MKPTQIVRDGAIETVSAAEAKRLTEAGEARMATERDLDIAGLTPKAPREPSPYVPGADEGQPETPPET